MDSKIPKNIEEISEKIRALKADSKGDLLILAHFYQHDDIVKSADFVGDSLQLAREATKRKDVRYINDIRNQYKDIKIAVHPECAPIVCQRSDVVGSTSLIKKTVENSPEGSIWAIGTEWNLVNRLKNENPDNTTLPLKESRCIGMAIIDYPKLLLTLEGIYNKSPVGVVSIQGNIKDDARTALNKMLEIE